MSLSDYTYRTFTYLAGDWTGDNDAIQKLHEWNEGQRWGVSFKDIHSETHSSDSSHNCSIKSSLRKRMALCKAFILIVGSGTLGLKSGACHTCFWYKKPSLSNLYPDCFLHNHIDNRSYIQYECEMARVDFNANKMDVIVLYNSVNVNKSLCPEILRSIGKHSPMKKTVIDSIGNTHIVWDYNSVKKAIG